MLFWIFFITIEILTILVLREQFRKQKLAVATGINLILSALLWFLLIKTKTYRGPFDEPGNICDQMNFIGVFSAIVLPRILLIILHYSGKLIRIRKGGNIRWVTSTGLIINGVALIVIVAGSTAGRFRMVKEEVSVKIKNLNPDLEGLRIVHLSDMHLASFHRHQGRLMKEIGEINSLKPDLIINTGDFVSYGWREFGSFDTVLSTAKSVYANLAVLGNHDMGTYLPGANDSTKAENIEKMKKLVISSGYRLLDNEHIFLNIRGTIVEFAGVETSGRFPEMIHTDVSKALSGIDSASLKILLIHDPNQWRKEVTGKTDVHLTLAGHTHGMQMGIITKWFRWSPAKYIYPEWNGLFRSGDQYLYVNRGFGVLAMPFRICMPPEITILTLERE